MAPQRVEGTTASRHGLPYSRVGKAQDLLTKFEKIRAENRENPSNVDTKLLVGAVIAREKQQVMVEYGGKVEVWFNEHPELENMIDKVDKERPELAPKPDAEDLRRIAEKGVQNFQSKVKRVRWSNVFSGSRKICLLDLVDDDRAKRCYKTTIERLAAGRLEWKRKETIDEFLRMLIAPQQQPAAIQPAGPMRVNGVISSNAGSPIEHNDSAQLDNVNVIMASASESAVPAAQSAGRPTVIVKDKNYSMVDYGNTVQVVKSDTSDFGEPLDQNSSQLAPKEDLAVIAALVKKSTEQFSVSLESFRWTEPFRQTWMIGLFKLKGDRLERRCTKTNVIKVVTTPLGLKSKDVDEIEEFLSKMAASQQQLPTIQPASPVHITDSTPSKAENAVDQNSSDQSGCTDVSMLDITPSVSASVKLLDITSPKPTVIVVDGNNSMVDYGDTVKVLKDKSTNLGEPIDKNTNKLAPDEDLAFLTKLAKKDKKEFSESLESVRWTEPFRGNWAIGLLKLKEKPLERRCMKGRLADLAVDHLGLERKNKTAIVKFFEDMIAKQQQFAASKLESPIHMNGDFSSITGSPVNCSSSGQSNCEDICMADTPASTIPAAQGAGRPAVIVKDKTYSMVDYGNTVRVLNGDTSDFGEPLDQNSSQLAPKEDLAVVTALVKKGAEQFSASLESFRWTEPFRQTWMIGLFKLKGDRLERRCTKTNVIKVVTTPLGLKSKDVDEIEKFLSEMATPKQHTAAIQPASPIHTTGDVSSNTSRPVDHSEPSQMDFVDVSMPDAGSSAIPAAQSARKATVIVTDSSYSMVDYGNTVKVLKEKFANLSGPLDRNSTQLAPKEDLAVMAALVKKGAEQFSASLESFRWTEPFRQTWMIGLFKLKGDRLERRCTKTNVIKVVTTPLGLKSKDVDEIEKFLSKMATPQQHVAAGLLSRQSTPPIVNLGRKNSLSDENGTRAAVKSEGTCREHAIVAKHFWFKNKDLTDTTHCMILNESGWSWKTWEEIQNLERQGHEFEDVDADLGFHPEPDRLWLEKFKSKAGKLKENDYCVPTVMARARDIMQVRTPRGITNTVFVEILDETKKNSLRDWRKDWERKEKQKWPGGHDAPLRCSPTLLNTVSEGAASKIKLGLEMTDAGRRFLALKGKGEGSIRERSMSPQTQDSMQCVLAANISMQNRIQEMQTQMQEMQEQDKKRYDLVVGALATVSLELQTMRQDIQGIKKIQRL